MHAAEVDGESLPPANHHVRRHQSAMVSIAEAARLAQESLERMGSHDDEATNSSLAEQSSSLGLATPPVGDASNDSCVSENGAAPALGSVAEEPLASPTAAAHRTFAFDFDVFALSASESPTGGPLTAVGSFLPTTENVIQVIGPTDEEAAPLGLVMWMPAAGAGLPALLASTSTSLHIWRFSPNGEGGSGPAGLQLVSRLQSSHHHEKSAGAPPSPAAAMTAFDWPAMALGKVATASVDSTITLWDVERERMETQMIAHDKAVLDVAFGHEGAKIFASVSEDGSLRLFDSRDLDHSTILYEDFSPLYRLYWSRLNSNLIATFAADNSDVIVLDMRKAGFVCALLKFDDLGASLAPNALAWSAGNSVAAGCSDGRAFLFDVSSSLAQSAAPPSAAPVAWVRPHSVLFDGREGGQAESAAACALQNIAWTAGGGLAVLQRRCLTLI